MEESKRQRQVARLIQEELGDIFLRENLNMVEGGMVSVSKVALTPDLLEARIHLSLFQTQDEKATLNIFKERTKEIRKHLGDRLKHQLRRIPELQFFLDDTLDHVFKMEALFEKIKQEKSQRPQDEEAD